MAYITTALGQKLADPATIQPFETAQVNANLLLLENKILALQADTGWVNCTLTGSWTGTCLARMLGFLVDIRVDISGGSVASGASTVFATLPPAVSKPSRAHVRGAGMASSKGIEAYVTMSGDLGFINTTGAVVTAATASAIYTVG